MNSLDSIIQQRQKEGKALKVFLLSSAIGSLALHITALTLPVGMVWHDVTASEEADEIEITVTEALPEEALPEPTPEELVADVPPLPEPDLPQEVAFAPDMAPPPLAPESQAPLTPGEDSPTKPPSSSTADPVTPLTNQSGDTAIGKSGTGPIASPDGKGLGFGRANQPTGFAPVGKPAGQPNGNSGGTSSPTATRQAPNSSPVQPVRPRQPTCLSCPKPKYQGTEASPRVDMRIRPDGTVEVRLRKSSGNPDVDRATLETMSKWRFDPKTVPEEGVRKRVRVTYEEEGSSFQRQNDDRRRQEAEAQREADRRRLADEEQRQQDRQPPPATATTESPASPAVSNDPPTAPEPVQVPESAPAEVPPPVEAPVELPPPEPAPVEAPAPAP